MGQQRETDPDIRRSCCATHSGCLRYQHSLECQTKLNSNPGLGCLVACMTPSKVLNPSELQVPALWDTRGLYLTQVGALKDTLVCCVCVSHSVVSDSLRPHGLEPTRLLCPWNSPGKNTGVVSHFFLRGIFLTQGSNLGLLHCRQILYHLSYQGSPLLSVGATIMKYQPLRGLNGLP